MGRNMCAPTRGAGDCLKGEGEECEVAFAGEDDARKRPSGEMLNSRMEIP